MLAPSEVWTCSSPFGLRTAKGAKDTSCLDRGWRTLGREKLAADLQSCCSPPYHASHTMALVPLADIQQIPTSTLRAGRSRRHWTLFSTHPSYGILVLFPGYCRLVCDPRPLDPLGRRVPGPHPQPGIAGQGLNLVLLMV